MVVSEHAWADVHDLRPHPQADLVPSMDADADAYLVQDIEANGVQVPLDVTSGGVVLDGRHRLRIAVALGMKGVPIRVVDPDDEVGYMVRMALHRRHLDTAQRKALAATLLRHRPERSDRSIARETGVSHPTVAAIREGLVGSGDVEELSTRTDSLGREQPAYRPAIKRATDALARYNASRVSTTVDTAPVDDPAIAFVAAIRRLEMSMAETAATDLESAVLRWARGPLHAPADPFEGLKELRDTLVVALAIVRAADRMGAS